jgi:hypothetical protein
MWPDFGDKFENSYCMVERGFRKKWEYVAWLYWYLIKWFKLPNYKDADLFTLDHLPHYPVLIGKHKYTLLEDGPFCHSVMMKNNLPYSTFEEQEYLLNLSIVEKGLFKIRKKLYGPVYYNRWGKNKYCTDIILSTDDYLDYFKTKKIHRLKFEGIWDSFSDEKQELILKSFDMTRDDVSLLKSKKIIILTQPLYPDYISNEEHGEIWRRIISKYPLNEIIVKPHPRDNYKYEDDFIGLPVFRKKIPSQFFEVLNLEFQKAVTTFTSAVFGLKVHEIDWYGTEVSDTIHKRIGGKPFIPEGLEVNHCKI